MKRHVLLILPLLVLFVACLPLQPAGPGAASDKGEAAVSLTVVNRSDLFFDEVTIVYPEKTSVLDALAPAASSETLRFSEIYQSPDRVEARVGETRFHFENLDRPQRTGETPIVAGDYQLTLSLNNQNLIIDLRPLPATDVLSVADLVEGLKQAGVTVESEPSIQRGTIFDELAGAQVATRQLLRANDGRIELFLFDDSATAAEMAAAILPGASYLASPEGEGRTIVIDGGGALGVTPLWWHSDTMLVLTHDRTLQQPISEALGQPSLDAQTTNPPDINLRLHNRSDQPLEEIAVTLGDATFALDALPSKATSCSYTLDSTHATDATLAVSLADGEQQLTVATIAPGYYTLVLDLSNSATADKPQLTLFNDRELVVDPQLIDVNWRWLYADMGDGTRHSAVAASLQQPMIRFSSGQGVNFGGPGLLYSGHTGCNGMGGVYFVALANGMLLERPGQTAVGCVEELMQSEQLFTKLLATVNRYRLDGVELMLLTHDGHRLYFEQDDSADKQPLQAIYQTILGEWGNGPYVVVAETIAPRAFDASANIVADADVDSAVREALAAGVQQTPALNAAVEIDGVVWVSPDERAQFRQDWPAFAARFPQASAVFAFSQIGFNDAKDQALIYYELLNEDGLFGYYTLMSRAGGSWRPLQTQNVISESP